MGWLGRVKKYVDPKSRRFYDDKFVTWWGQQGNDPTQLQNYYNANLGNEAAYSAFKKYDKVVKTEADFDPAVLSVATEWLHEEFGVHMFGGGFNDADFVIAASDNSGSPGYPWSAEFRTCADFYESDCASYLDRYFKHAGEPNGSAFAVWNSFLKEELRKEKKIDLDDYRQINGCPVELKVALNRYCLEQNLQFYNAYLRSPSCVGINPFSGGWQQLYSKLSRNGRFTHGYEADVKQYDAAFARVFLQIIRDFRWGLISTSFVNRLDAEGYEVHHRRFVRLYDQIIDSASVLSLGEVITTKQGNPSGSPNTVVDNTLGLYLLICYCWIRARVNSGADLQQLTKEEMDGNIALALYGDDNTYTGSQFGLSTLSPENVRAGASDFGWIIEFEQETPSPLKDLHFLSKEFVLLKQGLVVFRPVEPHKAYSSLAWRSDGDPLKSWSRACALHEMYFYCPEVRTKLRAYLSHMRRELDNLYGTNDEWLAVRNQLKPDFAIAAHYTGKELKNRCA